MGPTGQASQAATATRRTDAKTVRVREDHLMPVIAQFLDERVFGPDRPAYLAASNTVAVRARPTRQGELSIYRVCLTFRSPSHPTNPTCWVLRVHGG
jgi:hypothetical protein